MPPPRSYRELDVWQQAIELAVGATKLARVFPRSEVFVLSLQLRRAALSVSCNIAEGYGRSTRAEYMRFLRIARGSAAEVSSTLTVVRRLEYTTVHEVDALSALCDRVSAMLTRLLQVLEGR